MRAADARAGVSTRGCSLCWDGDHPALSSPMKWQMWESLWMWWSGKWQSLEQCWRYLLGCCVCITSHECLPVQSCTVLDSLQSKHKCSLLRKVVVLATMISCEKCFYRSSNHKEIEQISSVHEVVHLVLANWHSNIWMQVSAISLPSIWGEEDAHGITES